MANLSTSDACRIYLEGQASLQAALGSAPEDWTIREEPCEGGRAYRVTGLNGEVVVRQLDSLAAARAERATLAALEEAANHHPARGASHVLFYDMASGISVHEVLPSHVALSAGLVREVQFPSVGRHVGRLLAALRRLAPGEWSSGLLSTDEGDATAALTSMHSVLDVLNLLQRDTFPAQLASLTTLADTAVVAPANASLREAALGDAALRASLAALAADITVRRECLCLGTLSTATLHVVAPGLRGRASPMLEFMADQKRKHAARKRFDPSKPAASVTSELLASLSLMGGAARPRAEDDFDWGQAELERIAALAASDPDADDRSDTRILRADRSFAGPAGFDLGTLLGSLLLAHATAGAAHRVAAAAADKGGYAKFVAQQKADRALRHQQHILIALRELWLTALDDSTPTSRTPADSSPAAPPAALGGAGAPAPAAPTASAVDAAGSAAVEGAVPAALPAGMVAAFAGGAALVDSALAPSSPAARAAILALRVAGAQLVASVLAPVRAAPAELASIADPKQRASVERAALSLGRWLVLHGEVLVTRDARGTPTASQVWGRVEQVLASLGAVAGRPENAAAGDASGSITPVVGYVGDGAFCFAATVAVVAKHPTPGFCKSRLATSIGAEAAARVARACLQETLRLLGHWSPAELPLRRRLVFLTPAGGDAAAAQADLETLAREAGGDWVVERVPSESLVGPTSSAASEGAAAEGTAAESAAAEGGEARAPALPGLTPVLAWTTQTSWNAAWGPVLLVGSDCPTLPLDSLDAALRVAAGVDPRGPAAFLAPATDGGYVALALPLTTSPAAAFADVRWSVPSTLGSQAAVLAAEGTSVVVDRAVVSDVDTVEDLSTTLRRAAGLDA